MTCALPYNFRTDFLTKRNFKETVTYLNGLLQDPTRPCILLCLVRGPPPFPKRFPHRARSSASSFNFHCPLVSSRSAAVYVFFLVFPSLLSFPVSILQQCALPSNSNARCYQSIQPSFFLLYVRYSSRP